MFICAYVYMFSMKQSVFSETVYSLLGGKVLHENNILYTRESYIPEVAGQLNH